MHAPRPRRKPRWPTRTRAAWIVAVVGWIAGAGACRTEATGVEAVAVVPPKGNAAAAGTGNGADRAEAPKPAARAPAEAGDAEADPAQAASSGAARAVTSGGSTSAAAENAGTVGAASGEAGEEPQGDRARPRRVLILGDSLAATGFGALLEKALDDDPRIVAYRKGKSSSGLSRPDFFDWVDAAKRQIEFRDPELVVVILGGNDGQDLAPAPWHPKRVRWQTPAWEAGYRARVDALLDVLVGPSRRVLWLGLPRTQTVKFEKKLETIRRIQREAVEARAPAAVYLDLSPLLQNPDGSLTRTVERGGKRRAVRAEDGIHFTMEGSRYLAERVAPEVVRALGLPPRSPEEASAD